MFERYTERARRVIFFGRQEASNFGSMTIETEHLLLGLIRKDRNVAERFTRDKTAWTNIHDAVTKRVTKKPELSTSIDMPLSLECKRILAYAAEEAERLRHGLIVTEHLLLGMLREEKCVAAQILQEQGLKLEAIRGELASLPRPVEPPTGIFRHGIPAFDHAAVTRVRYCAGSRYCNTHYRGYFKFILEDPSVIIFHA